MRSVADALVVEALAAAMAARQVEKLPSVPETQPVWAGSVLLPVAARGPAAVGVRPASAGV